MRGPCAEATVRNVRYSPSARVRSSSAPSWSWRFDIRRDGVFRRGRQCLIDHNGVGVNAVAEAGAISDVLQHIGERNLTKVERDLCDLCVLRSLPDEVERSFVL